MVHIIFFTRNYQNRCHSCLHCHTFGMFIVSFGGIFGMRCLLDWCLERKLTRIHFVTRLQICQIVKIVLRWNYEVDWKLFLNYFMHNNSHNDELHIKITWSNFLLLAPKNSHSINLQGTWWTISDLWSNISRKILDFLSQNRREWENIGTCQYLRHVPDVVQQVKEELWWECLFAHGRNMLDACHQLLTMCVDVFGDHLFHVEVVVNGFDPRCSLQIVGFSVVLFQDRLLGCIGSAVSIQA